MTEPLKLSKRGEAMARTNEEAVRSPVALPIERVRERLARLEDAPGEIKLYLLGAVCGALGLALAVYTSEFSAEIGRALFVAGSIGLSLGIVKETYDWLLPTFSTNLGKALGALALASLGALVFDLADTTTNIATGAPSGTFANATVVFSLLVGVQLLYVLIVIVGFFVFFGVMLSSGRWAAVDFWNTKVLGRPSPVNIDREMTLWGVRLMASVMLISLATVFGQKTEQPLREWTYATMRAYVFHAAMDSNDPCVHGNARMVRLSEEVVLMAEKTATGYAFERQRCGLLGQAPD